MTEAWNEAGAEQAQATLDALPLVDRLTGLLSDSVLELAGLTLLGALIGIACTGVVKRIWPPLNDAPADYREPRLALYTRCGVIFGGLWTAILIYDYVEAGPLVSLTLALGLAVLGAGATPRIYDFLDWCRTTMAPKLGAAIIGWIARRFGAP